MTDRTCLDCNKIFKLPYLLKLHKNRKTSCKLIINEKNIENEHICTHCNRTFKSQISKCRHIREYCKIKQITKNKENNIQNQITQLSNTVNQLLKKETAQHIETQNIQNIETQNNNNITINCNILPYPEMNIKHDNILNPFLKENSAANEYAKISYLNKVDIKNSEGRLNPKGFIANNQLISSAIIEIIENIYADSENRNIYLLKKDKVMVYQEDGIWCIKSLDNVNRELCGNIVQNVKNMRDKIVYPKEVYNGEKTAINETFRALPMEYGTAKPEGFIANNTSKILKNSKNELSIILESIKDKLKNDKLIT